MPFAIEELLALIVIDCSVAAVTERAKALEVIPFWAAVMLLDPIAAPVAKPPALMLTAAEFEDTHVAVLVKFWVLPSLKVPIAVNGTLVPLAIEEVLALIAIDCSAAAVTDSVKLFEVMPFWDAVTLLEPTAVPVARPVALMLIVA